LRPPEIIHQGYKNLMDILNTTSWFPNVNISFKNREEFLLSVKNEADIVIFTGKPENGSLLRKSFSKNCLFIMNGAGHNPIVIGENANLEKAVESTIYACLYNQGQDCSSPNAILVKYSQLEAFKNILFRELYSIKDHIGDFSDKKNVVGPNSYVEKVFNIAKFIEKNFKHCVFGGNLNLRSGLIEPLVIEKPLKDGPNFHEFFAPIIMIQSYDKDEELVSYFEHEKYSKNAMYVSIFGESSYISTLEQGGKLHNVKNVLHDVDLHSVERGFLPFGGYGWASSSIYFNGQEIRGPTLIQREIFVYKVLENYQSTRLEYDCRSANKKEPDNTFAPWKRKLLVD
jgi:lysyl-tRNA synthetase, class I